MRFNVMKRFILFLIAILLITGCAPQIPEETTAVEETQPSPPPMIEIDSSYTIIFASGDASYEAAYAFSKLYAKATGVTLKMKKDTMTEPTEKEIVIGKTNREEFYAIDHDSLVADAFVLALSGKRLFISASSTASSEPK
jgi:hypothetical protein